MRIRRLSKTFRYNIAIINFHLFTKSINRRDLLVIHFSEKNSDQFSLIPDNQEAASSGLSLQIDNCE
jgi:hypothetical protein